MCFYQSFAYGIVPIIFEAELKLYSKLLCSGVNIKDSCLVLPNQGDKTDKQYALIVDNILRNEFRDGNNYLNKIKNHSYIFSNFNWFTRESLPKPVENIINHLMQN